MARSSSQHRLFDLVMLVILAGLAFGFGRCLWQIRQQHDSLPRQLSWSGSGAAFGLSFGGRLGPSAAGPFARNAGSDFIRTANWRTPR
jgi:hypothetical protein